MDILSIIFPGQGSQAVGMGKDLYENFAAAKKVFDIADSILNRKISELCFNGTDEELIMTINSQPCILAVEIAAYEVLKEKLKFNPVAFAGHSLGEYAALYAAEVLDLETVFILINKRAELMNKFAENSTGIMAAVIGLDDETVKNVTDSIDGVYVANYNSKGQVVITGDKSQIMNSIHKFKEYGARKVIPLAVSGAFHSPYMKGAADEFKEFIDKFDFKDSKIPVYTNVDGKYTVSGKEFKDKLPRQIYSSVCWTQTINNIFNNGCSKFIEAGPGSVLYGLNRKINSQIITYNISDVESLNQTIIKLTSKEEKELV